MIGAANLMTATNLRNLTHTTLCRRDDAWWHSGQIAEGLVAWASMTTSLVHRTRSRALGVFEKSKSMATVLAKNPTTSSSWSWAARR